MPLLRRTLAATALVLALAGCEQAQQVGGDIASSAAAQAGQAAKDQVRQQVCAQVQDRQLSPQAEQVLTGLLPAARTAGLPAQLLTPLEQIAQSGEQTQGEAVDALRTACAPPTPSP